MLTLDNTLFAQTIQALDNLLELSRIHLREALVWDAVETAPGQWIFTVRCRSCRQSDQGPNSQENNTRLIDNFVHGSGCPWLIQSAQAASAFHVRSELINISTFQKMDAFFQQKVQPPTPYDVDLSE